MPPFLSTAGVVAFILASATAGAAVDDVVVVELQQRNAAESAALPGQLQVLPAKSPARAQG